MAEARSNRRPSSRRDRPAVPTAYPDLVGLEQVLLEAAPVERLVVKDDRVVLTVSAALLGEHPAYEPPPRGETHTRIELVLDWRAATSVRWERSADPEPWTLSDLAVFDAGRSFELRGGFGRIRIEGRPPRVGGSRAG